jgi:Cys-rich repeat protein
MQFPTTSPRAPRRHAPPGCAVALLLALSGSLGCATEAFDHTDGAIPDGVVLACTGTGDCRDPVPLCHTDQGICVQCLEDTDCADGVCDPHSHTCVQCTDDAHCPDSTCHPPTGTCVDCVEDADCPDPGASHCDLTTHSCSPCAGDAHCAHLDSLPSCHEGTCVQCTPDTEAEACPGTSCDPATLTCTEVSVGSVGLCQPCTADSECESGVAVGGTTRCVPIMFQGESRGHVCLLDQDSTADGCPQPYASTREVTSAAGVTGSTYCYPPESLTTCEAIIDFSSPCSTSESCGDDALNDGLCRDDGPGDRCTYACGGDTACPDGFKCRSGASPRYCCTNTPQEGPCAL